MKAIPLTIHWHEHNQPIYSAHFEPNGKGRLATAGGDNNVRIWRVQGEGEESKVVYLSTLAKHNQAVNVVRFCPRGEMLASAGDDGNIILWVPAEPGHRYGAFGEDDLEDKETWRLKHMCRSMGSEIYDLAWSPDGIFFITGSMDNIARVWNAQTGQMVRQIAEHNHYVQGVAWDPLNEFVATQSSDRSVHIYTLKSKDGQFSLSQHGKISRMDLPPRRPMEFSPKVHGLGVKNANIYYNETLTSFFRRLTFTPDGSLLFTPAGQYRTSNPTTGDGAKTADDVINTVYIYTRAGLNKPPIAHLPGHKKPSIAVKCSSVLYTFRRSTPSGPDPTASAPSTSAPSNAAFSLPYRMVYAVATQDAVLIYDTQQQTPLCIVSNLHYAAFTDLTWSSDGNTLLMTSTDGFCSVVVFSPGELGEKYTGPIASTGATTPSGTPTHPTSNPAPTHKTPLTPGLPVSPVPPARHSNSPTRSSSSSSISTPGATAINNPRPTVGSLPSVSASVAGVPLTTPPQTPLGANSSVLGKRDEGPVKQDGNGSEGVSGATTGGDKKRRRIAPTQVVPDGTQETPNAR
ncbi:WD40 repeat-like protein [Tuber magnatum]|uniref:WD40 repeat-like protein n=1 Tax=Tuber magnatum TaxID=42249 RepID=A0A317SHT6_9PEZI|nr:WD40 repeat-like protein [Tuber magnatum]